MLRRIYRIRKHLLVATASLPLMQASGCTDPIGLVVDFTTGVGGQIASGVIIASAQALIQLILTKFPGADLIQALLGGNAGFFNV